MERVSGDDGQEGGKDAESGEVFVSGKRRQRRKRREHSVSRGEVLEEKTTKKGTREAC